MSIKACCLASNPGHGLPLLPLVRWKPPHISGSSWPPEEAPVSSSPEPQGRERREGAGRSRRQPAPGLPSPWAVLGCGATLPRSCDYRQRAKELGRPVAMGRLNVLVLTLLPSVLLCFSQETPGWTGRERGREGGRERGRKKSDRIKHWGLTIFKLEKHHPPDGGDL